MGLDDSSNVLVESDRFKITTKAKEIYLFHFRSDKSFLPWKRLLNEKLGNNFNEIFVEKEEVNKSVAAKFKTMKQKSEMFFNKQNKKSEHLYEKQGQEVKKIMEETNQEVDNILEETRKKLKNKFLSSHQKK